MMPAKTVVDTYRELMEKALSTPADNVAPLLQQLGRYDARLIAEYENAADLSTSIVVKALQEGMMKDKTAEEVECSIQRFTKPPKLDAHGRGITLKQAKECGLNIDEILRNDDIADPLWELYVRTNHYVSTIASKAVESATQSYIVGVPQQQETRNE
jgi:hypothetical protein